MSSSVANMFGMPVPEVWTELSNNIESAALELDENASIISYEEYYPYGETSYRAGRNVAEVGLKRYRYTGKEKDEESGLYYYGARYYSPMIEIFISVDPRSEEYPEVSPYVYCMNNPVKYIDPDGKEVYILFYTEGNNKGDNLFKAAAETREKSIKSMPSYDDSKDKVLIYGITDISDIGKKSETAAKNYGDTYGKTIEIGVWSHSGISDGPIGTTEASTKPLSEKSKQMSREGWESFNFNWKKEGASMNFYGCNTGNDKYNDGKSFAKMVSGLNNMKGVDVSGQPTSAYPSSSSCMRISNFSRSIGIFDFGKTYMVAGDKNEGFKSMWFNQSDPYPIAKPMNIYKNGRKLGSAYQRF